MSKNKEEKRINSVWADEEGFPHYLWAPANNVTWGTLFKTMNHFKMTTEHYTKHRSLLNAGLCATARVHFP